MKKKRDLDATSPPDLDRRRAQLLTVKQYAHVAQLHPASVWRRVRAGRQPGVHRVGGGIRLDPPDDDEDD